MSNDIQRRAGGASRAVLILALTGLVGASVAWGTDMAAQPLKLDGQWQFRTDPDNVGLSERWFDQPATGKAWRPVPVPASWDDYDCKDYDGVGWYARTFAPPERTDGRRRAICVMGVDDEAVVFVNGVEVARTSQYNRRFGGDIEDVLRPGDNTIFIRVTDRGGPGGLIRSVHIADYARDVNEVLAGPWSRKSARETVDWARDAVIYQVYLRSFSPEGTLPGLERRLDELDRLGVTVLWLMPIHPVGVKGRKGTLGSPYAVQDYLAVNPEFGTMDDLKSLVAAAHARDMKVILDWVVNHTAWDHPWITEHPDWYKQDENGDIVSPVPDWNDVAALNYDVPAVRREMEAALLYWVREADIDGYRCDVAGMVPLDFWESVRPKLDALKPVLMLAEDDDPAQHVVNFDLTYDWGTYAILDNLKDGRVRAADIERRLDDEALDYPRGSLRMRFTSNHDKCAWVAPALQRYGPDGAAAAAVLTFTMPGIPLIYNGQEVGNATPLPLFGRVAIDWSSPDHGLRELYAQLARLRAEHPPLRRGETEFVDGLGDGHLLAMVRATGDERVVVLINLGGRPQTVSLKEPLFDGLTPRLQRATQTGDEVTLPSLGYWVGSTP